MHVKGAAVALPPHEVPGLSHRLRAEPVPSLGPQSEHWGLSGSA